MTDRRMISKDFLKSSIAWKAGGIGEEPDEGLAALNVFLAMILLADDYGNGRYIPQMILIEALGSQPKVLDKYSGSNVEAWIKVFSEEGAIRIYEIDNQEYFSLTGWEHYQRGNWRPSESRIPRPTQEAFDKYLISNGKVLDKSGESNGLKEVNKIEFKGIESKEDIPPESKATSGDVTTPVEKKPKKPKPALIDFDAVYTGIVERYFARIEIELNEANKIKQVDAIDKLVRLDKFDSTEVETTFNWLIMSNCTRAEWWRGVTKSFITLRENRKGVKCYKYLNLRAAFEESSGNSQAPGNYDPDQSLINELLDNQSAQK